METMYYPAIFHQSINDEFSITFPDFPEYKTRGKNMNDAYKMATETIGAIITNLIKNNKKIPNATLPCDLTLSEGDFSCLIEFDYIRYNRLHNNKAVKKTLTIPEWLNEACLEQNINFSQVLQEALIEKISSVQLNLNKMSTAQLDDELRKGLDDITNGHTYTSDEIEAEMKKLYNS